MYLLKKCNPVSKTFHKAWHVKLLPVSVLVYNSLPIIPPHIALENGLFRFRWGFANDIINCVVPTASRGVSGHGRLVDLCVLLLARWCDRFPHALPRQGADAGRPHPRHRRRRRSHCHSQCRPTSDPRGSAGKSTRLPG